MRISLLFNESEHADTDPDEDIDTDASKNGTPPPPTDAEPTRMHLDNHAVDYPPWRL